MPFTYVLLCSDKTYYTGSTWDLLTRLRQHRSGEGAEYTKRRLPVKLVYYEQYELIVHAFHREKKIQGWTHGKKRKLVREGPGVQVEDDTRVFE
ncbi:MAG: GIY-YIG nuclease family protein [Aeromicrobium sp.]